MLYAEIPAIPQLYASLNYNPMDYFVKAAGY
jgi:hypothetical protein